MEGLALKALRVERFIEVQVSLQTCISRMIILSINVMKAHVNWYLRPEKYMFAYPVFANTMF